VGYNSIALPIAAGVFEPSLGLMLLPEIAALSMSGSSFIVAVNALMLKRLKLPDENDGVQPTGRPPLAGAEPSSATAS
jgi:Cu2+-exporting ATPase